MATSHADGIVALWRTAIADAVEDVPPIALTEHTLPLHSLPLIIAKQHEWLAFKVQTIGTQLLAKQFDGTFAGVETVSLPSDVELLSIAKDKGIDGFVGGADKRSVIDELTFRSVSHSHTNATGAIALLPSRIVAHNLTIEVEEFWSPKAAASPFGPLIEDETHRLPHPQVLRTVALIGLPSIARSGCSIIGLANTNDRRVWSIGIDNGILDLGFGSFARARTGRGWA